MFIQTQKTPNPNSLKFLPGKKVSNDGPYEILNKDETDNSLLRNILSINGVTGIFLSEDFLFNKVRATKNAAEEGSPGTSILNRFRYFFPYISINFFLPFFTLIA